jgi:hypothetical protein
MCLNDTVKEDALFEFVMRVFFGGMIGLVVVACVAELV